MSNRYAVVSTKDMIGLAGEDIPAGTVWNIVLWDGESPFDPGENLELRQSDTLQIGDTVPAQDG